MHWNKTEINGDTILLLGQITTDPDNKNAVVTKQNAKEVEQLIVRLQEVMAANGIDSINVSWSGAKLLRQSQTKQTQEILSKFAEGKPN